MLPRAVSIVGIIGALIATTGAANPASGSLDPGFGVGGKVMTDMFGGPDEGNAAVVQGGTVLVAGYAAPPQSGSGDFALARYNRDGGLDTSFGTQGKVRTDFLSGSDGAAGVATQLDGHIVVAGTAFPPSGSNPDFAVARYNRDGSLDKTFGNGGKVTTDIGAHDTASGLVVQRDGKIVVAGTNYIYPVNRYVALTRYNRDGSLDKTFGTGGKAVTPTAADTMEEATALILQADGRIVVAGTRVSRDGPNGFVLLRYNPRRQPGQDLRQRGKGDSGSRR